MMMKFRAVALVLSMGGLFVLPLKPTAISHMAKRDILKSSLLLIAGAWLAHKQLPRLAGQQIEYNAPLFTKVVASLLFTIGVTGGCVGAKRLWSSV